MCCCWVISNLSSSSRNSLLVVCIYTSHIHCQCKTVAVFPRQNCAHLQPLFLYYLPKIIAVLFLHKNNSLHQVPKSYFIWQATARLVFCLPVAVIGGLADVEMFAWRWKADVLWVAISYFECASLHSLNVTPMRAVVMEWSCFKMRNEENWQPFLGQKTFPSLYIATFRANPCPREAG